ncbi:MAG TPA: hypothetical protein VMR25_13420 [Planctomycetaceae bacterium]|jgi:hypothetical protein|nr:hypothetical protein [Planctomycetaceae bacterium]
MTQGAKALAILLRVIGVIGLFALGPVLMPFSWMTSTHRWLGLGEMPAAPVVEYLARSVSAFYAMFGALCLVLSTDVERYCPVVRSLGVLGALMGVIFIGADTAAGMPLWWTITEGPPTIAFGALVFFLARDSNRWKTSGRQGGPVGSHVEK